jgi:predicted TIM-barrel fold metal-dependent hydrolase
VIDRPCDIHQHLWPEAFVAALREREQPPFLDRDELVLVEGRFEGGLRDHDLARRLALLDRDGIGRAVVSLQPSLGLDALPDDERHGLEDVWLDGTRELLDAAEGRLLAFAPGRAAEGFAGAVVPAGALLDLESAAPLLDELERRGDLLFVHPGPARPPAGASTWWAGIVDYTAQMQAAYYAWLDRGEDRWPELRIVFAILAGGAPFQLERLGPRGVDVRSALDANVFFDTATYGRRAIELCLETFGVHQVVYGSDVPVVDSQPTLDAVRGFGDSVHRIVTVDNPGRLLA